MSTHSAETLWSRNGQPFTGGRYSRRHTLRFDGGTEVPGSASPHVVPPPWSASDAVDPEEAFVAALSSCHMLWFLSLAAKAGFVVDEYHDRADGTMGPGADGRLMMRDVTLRPFTRFAGTRQPDAAELAALHHRAHEECFIANSVKTAVHCEPRIDPA